MADEILNAPPRTPVPDVTPPRPSPQKFTNLPGKVGGGSDADFTFVPPPTQEEQEARVAVAIPDRPDLTQPVKQFPKREEFVRNAFESLGGNPFAIDPVQEVERQSADLRPLFQHVFSRRIYWGDRDKLEPEDKKFWDATVKAYRSLIYNEVVSKRETQIATYNNLMSRFDNDVAEQKVAEGRVIARRKEVQTQLKATRLAEKAEVIEKRAVRQEERAEINLLRADEREDRLQKASKFMQEQAKKRGLPKPKIPTRANILAIVRFEEDLFDPEIYELGSQIQAADLRDWNRMREATGLPIVREIVATGAGFKGSDYQYIEAEEAPTALEEPAVPVKESVLEDSEFDIAVREQHPNAQKIEGRWWMLNAEGRVVEIQAGE